MTGPLRRAAGNLRRRWRRILALLVVGAGVVAPIVTGLWWSLPLVWFLGIVVVLPVLHTLAKPLPDADGGSAGSDDEADPALDALRERYARGEIDEEEFERRLDRLLATEDAETRDREGVAARVRENARREVERLRR
ncbi:hypothetical protein GCM10027435_11970 [Haloparvum alkalitolerans]|uniref:SHOCT domain-containing protein n=1 Tax=Haloparvum alkalitolerans TaxID=1042953 RepID=UPI003CF0535B